MIDPSYRYLESFMDLKWTYFVLSGLDGSGKTTQIELLKKNLEKQGKSVIISHHSIDDNTFFKNTLRYIYTNVVNEKISQNDISYMLAFEYLGFFIENIMPKLTDNTVVLMDRGVYDLLVSQTTIFNDNFDKGWIILEKICNSGIHFFLDVSPEICSSRIQNRNKEVKLHETLSVLSRKYVVYKKLVSEGCLISVNGELSIQEVNKELEKKIKLFLEK